MSKPYLLVKVTPEVFLAIVERAFGPLAELRLVWENMGSNLCYDKDYNRQLWDVTEKGQAALGFEIVEDSIDRNGEVMAALGLAARHVSDTFRKTVRYKLESVWVTEEDAEAGVPKGDVCLSYEGNAGGRSARVTLFNPVPGEGAFAAVAAEILDGDMLVAGRRYDPDTFGSYDILSDHLCSWLRESGVTRAIVAFASEARGVTGVKEITPTAPQREFDPQAEKPRLSEWVAALQPR